MMLEKYPVFHPDLSPTGILHITNNILT